MSDDTTTITVTVEINDRVYIRQVTGTHWARDDADRLYVYNDDQTVLELGDRATVLEIMREADVDTVAILDRHADAGDELADTTATPN